MVGRREKRPALTLVSFISSSLFFFLVPLLLFLDYSLSERGAGRAERENGMECEGGGEEIGSGM